MRALEILSRSFRVLERNRDPGTRKRDPHCGVYLLVEDNAIVYVGSSRNIEVRIGGHAAEAKQSSTITPKPLDLVLWYPLPLKVHSYYEGALIRGLNPRHNRCAPKYCGYDNEILSGFGLPRITNPARTALAWSKKNGARMTGQWDPLVGNYVAFH